MDKKPLEISLCLIVKNEESVLERCINSMKGMYDELIICDTGSTDRTVEIANKLGAKVIHFKWIDDFAAARNYSFEHATKPWIVYVDADDILMEGDGIKVRNIINSYDYTNIMGIHFPYVYSHESVGSSKIPNFKYYRLRAMKREANPVWAGRIHEYIKLNGNTINCGDVLFHHYRDDGKGTQNTARNLRILKKSLIDCSDEDKPRYLFYYGKECIYNNLYDEAIKAFKEYIPISKWLPEKHRALYEMATCYSAKGDIDNAITYLFEAIKLDENYIDPYIHLGMLAYGRKDWKNVIKWMTTATLCNTPSTLFFDYIPFQTYVPYDYMAIAYWNLGEYKKGYDCILKCLEYKPTDKRFLFNKKTFEDKFKELGKENKK